MNTNDTIRRAMMRTPQPELPASFTPQLMVRVRRRSCLRTLLHNAALTAVAILVVAAAIAAMVLFLPQSSLRQPSPTAVYDLKPEPLSQTFKNLLPSMPELPKLPRGEMTDVPHEQVSFWAHLSGVMLLLIIIAASLGRPLRQRRRERHR